MAYTKQTWADLPSKTTPINATRLTHIEDGIFNAAATADNAASTAGTAAANIGIVTGRVETLTGRVNGLDTAVSNKVDKVAGKGLSTNDYDDTDKGKVDSLGTASTKNSTSVVTQSTDLVESGAVYDVVADIYEDNGVLGAKNLLPPYLGVDPAAGVTYTQNTDGTISTSGTATGEESFARLMINADFIAWLNANKGKTFTLNGCPEGGSSSTYYIGIWANNGLVVSDTGEGEIFTVPNVDCTSANIAIHIKVGTNVTGKTFYPMLRLASDTDPTYQPYAQTNRELTTGKTDNSVIGTVEDGTTASQAYAVREHFIRNGAFCTVTQAISSGGTLTEGTNYTSGNVADNLVYKAGDSIEVGDGTYPTMYNGIFFSNNTALRFVIRVDKKIIANNVAISNSGIGICNADGIVASVLNLTANYNIIILNIKNTDIQVQMSKKDGTAFSVTDGSTAVVRFYGTLTFS